MKTAIRAALVCPASMPVLVVLVLLSRQCIAVAQNTDDRSIADHLIEVITNKYNQEDFKAIYDLASEEFKKGIGEEKFVQFMRRNRNSGNILKTSLKTLKGNVATYLLELESRDLILTFEVKPPSGFSSFGLKSAPAELLAQVPEVRSDNPLATPFDRAVDVAVRKYFLNTRAAGLSLGAIRNGTKHAYHYGEASKGTLPTSKTRYEIGSITKTFTATLLAQAVCDQKVDLGDDIRKYLGEGFTGLEFEGRPITFRDLANHTSCLPTLPKDLGSQPGANPLQPESNYGAALFFAALRKVKLEGRPGEKFEYSNWGMALLGFLLEKVYGRPYHELLAKHVTNPLRMLSTTYKSLDGNRSRAAVGHTENGRVALYQDVGLFGPAGDILSNLDDMLLYLEAQLSEEMPSIALTHQLTSNGMGLGWGVRKSDGHREIQHNGSTNGFTSHISGFMDSKSGCVILTNSKAELGGLIAGIHAVLKTK